MDESVWLAERFEEHRARLRAVAYRMLGSLSEADDAVQEAWLRLSRSDPAGIENLGGWLTTVVGRVCLDHLRSRGSRREAPLGADLPDPVVTAEEGGDPEQEALLADSVGLALLVVLDRLGPAERLAFVLHDMFGVSFDEIAPMVRRTPTAARQLASRARRRVRGAAPPASADLGHQRAIVDAFLSAARDGDFDGLLEVLDPDVVLRADGPGAPRGVRGALAVVRNARAYSHLAQFARPVRVNGTPGFVVIPDGKPFAVIGFTIAHERIVEIDIFADPDRLVRLGIADL